MGSLAGTQGLRGTTTPVESSPPLASSVKSNALGKHGGTADASPTRHVQRQPAPKTQSQAPARKPAPTTPVKPPKVAPAPPTHVSPPSLPTYGTNQPGSPTTSDTSGGTGDTSGSNSGTTSGTTTGSSGHHDSGGSVDGSDAYYPGGD